jgi:hypothetical protein
MRQIDTLDASKTHPCWPLCNGPVEVRLDTSVTHLVAGTHSDAEITKKTACLTNTLVSSATQMIISSTLPESNSKAIQQVAQKLSLNHGL